MFGGQTATSTQSSVALPIHTLCLTHKTGGPLKRAGLVGEDAGEVAGSGEAKICSLRFPHSGWDPYYV